MVLPGGKSFDEFVREIKRKQGVTDEAARKIAGSVEQKVQKARLELKLMSMKYASVHGTTTPKIGKPTNKFVKDLSNTQNPKKKLASVHGEPFEVKQTPTTDPKKLIQMQRQPKSPLPTKKRTASLHLKKNKKTPIVSDGKPQKTIE